MDKATPMYLDVRTGTYGEVDDLIMIPLTALELRYFENMSESEIVAYCQDKAKMKAAT